MKLSKRQKEVLASILDEARYNFFHAKADDLFNEVDLGDFSLDERRMRIIEALEIKGMISYAQGVHGYLVGKVILSEQGVEVAKSLYDDYYVRDWAHVYELAVAANANGGVLPEEMKSGNK